MLTGIRLPIQKGTNHELIIQDTLIMTFCCFADFVQTFPFFQGETILGDSLPIARLQDQGTFQMI